MRIQPVTTTAGGKPQVPVPEDAEENQPSQSPSHSAVSTLARQLGAAAARAQVRDASHDLQALAQKASQVLGELSSRAHQSEQQNDGAGFQGMPRDQLALIIYDDSGEFTVKERVSAWQQASDQEQRWRQHVTHNALNEYDTSGKMTGFFNQALGHFKSLPLIEQAQYPREYVVDLQRNMDLDLKHRTPAQGWPVLSPLEIVQKSLPEPEFNRLSSSSEPSTIARAPQTETSVIKNNSDVDDRGRQLMLTRLFGGREPPARNGADGMKLENIACGGLEFLTKQDCALLADIYAYVQDKDVDLDYLDNIAIDLGHYRRHDNGRTMANFNDGHGYDSQGWQLSVAFTERDAATASRLLNGSAINTTRLDEGFLRYTLDPGHGALGCSGDFDFLEHIVTRFSAEPHTATPLGRQFSTYVPIDDNYVMTASTSVRISLPDPDFITENGVTRLTERGRARGIKLEEVNDKAVRPHLELARAKAGLEIFRQWRDGDRHLGAPGWLGSLWERLEKQ
jgi:hypothetical protein